MVGERIKALRLSRRMKQTELADALQIQSRTLMSYEQETRNVPLDMLVSIADYFDVSTDFLLGREEKPTDQRVGLVQEGASTTCVPSPDAVAAHTDSQMSEEMKAEIAEIARQVFEKYAKH